MIGPEFNDSVCTVKDRSEVFEATAMTEQGAFVDGSRKVGKTDNSYPFERRRSAVDLDLDCAGDDCRYVTSNA